MAKNRKKSAKSSFFQWFFNNFNHSSELKISRDVLKRIHQIIGQNLYRFIQFKMCIYWVICKFISYLSVVMRYYNKYVKLWFQYPINLHLLHHNVNSRRGSIHTPLTFSKSAVWQSTINLSFSRLETTYIDFWLE